MTTWTTVDRVVPKDSICHMQEAVTGEVKALFLCYPDAAGHSANDIFVTRFRLQLFFKGEA